jgi:hypothetical protein
MSSRELFERLRALSPDDTPAIEALLPWRIAERDAKSAQPQTPREAAV